MHFAAETYILVLTQSSLLCVNRGKIDIPKEEQLVELMRYLAVTDLYVVFGLYKVVVRCWKCSYIQPIVFVFLYQQIYAYGDLCAEISSAILVGVVLDTPELYRVYQPVNCAAANLI